MSESVLAALTTGVLSLLGVIVSNMAAARKTENLVCIHGGGNHFAPEGNYSRFHG